MSTKPTDAGYRVIGQQATPNPNAIKFMLDRPITDRPISFLTAAAGKNHPLAERLFAIEGVSSLLLLNDFVTVNKRPDVEWKSIVPSVKKLLSGRG